MRIFPGPAAGQDPGARPRPLGLLIDYGGVLTTDVFASFAGFCVRAGLAADRVARLFRADPVARQLLAGLETGTLAVPDFEDRFAALLGVPATDLIPGLMADVRPDPQMVDAVRRIRAAGFRTGLVSNSWGAGSYDQHLLGELFDGVVISAEAGVRKPEPEIYRLGAEAIGLAPGECVFVDDLGGNLKPARELGMATVRHHDAEETVRQLAQLFGLDLAG
jgi:epoxide hydrolase-like predicted phosphatase